MPSNPAATFRLPATLTALGLVLRDETKADVPFLIDLYATTRARELDGVPWSAPQKRAFVEQQFGLQRHHYRTRLDNVRFGVLECDGMPIGRLYLEQHPGRLHIVDITLDPAMCGQGIGTAILRALADHAAAHGCALGLSVAPDNPALRLYKRLGFVTIGAVSFHHEMERPADAPARIR